MILKYKLEQTICSENTKWGVNILLLKHLQKSTTEGINWSFTTEESEMVNKYITDKHIDYW